MASLKQLELGFRRFLLRSLGRLTRRRNELPPNVDFNRCKFLFIRQDRIGDVLVSTPLFALLKKYYPDAVIDVLLSKNNYFVLEHDTFIRKRWKYTKRFLSSLRVLSGIRTERYDFVIDLMDNPSATSTVIALLAGGKWNIGIEKDNRYAYDIVVPLLSRKDTHIVDRLAQLLTVFGIQPHHEDLRVHVALSPESERFVDEFLRNYVHGDSRIIGMNISAGSDTRYWGTSKYRALLRLIQETFSTFTVMVVCKSEDRDRANEILGSGSSAILAPEMNFNEFAALIRRLHVLITPDTSAVHVAAAFSVPSVVLYVQSDSNLRIWEPYKTACEPIVTAVDDLSTIPVPSVFEALQRLLVKIHNVKGGRVSGMTERV